MKTNLSEFETVKLIYKNNGDCPHNLICKDCPLGNGGNLLDNYCPANTVEQLLVAKAWLFDHGYTKKDLEET